jgi:hypothetical protein
MLQSGAKTASRGVPASPAIRLQENACVLQGGREVGVNRRAPTASTA